MACCSCFGPSRADLEETSPGDDAVQAIFLVLPVKLYTSADSGCWRSLGGPWVVE